MKDRIDPRLVTALLKKGRRERYAVFRERNFDVLGFVLRILLVGAIVALFVVFFGRFCDVYLAVRTAGQPDPVTRGNELLTMVYTALLCGTTVSCIGTLSKELFKADDNRLYSALPIGAKTLFVTKLLSVYASQLVVSLVAVLTVDLTYGLHAAVPWSFWLSTAALILVFPVIPIALAALLVLPYQMLKRFLKEKFALFFVAVTVALGVFFLLYSFVLAAVKELLLGDSLRYFFNDRVMGVVSAIVSFLYPARWIGDVLTETNPLMSWLFLVLFALVCLAVSVLVIRSVFTKAVQERNAGPRYFTRREKKIKPKRSPFHALLKREFLLIFRTPSYAFSYFSVALIMPVMVYFCMDVGASLVRDLVGISCDLELALFLNVLFGALTNVFCGTNISRDGETFYLVKAMPVGYKEVFFSKIVLCCIVAEISQLFSAVLLAATGLVAWYDGIFLFAIGSLFGFAYICVSTRYDFNHAHFSPEANGEIRESGGAASVSVVLGVAASLLTGGLLFLLKMMEMFRRIQGGFTYLLAGALALAAAGGAIFYLLFRLREKYRVFTGGGL